MHVLFSIPFSTGSVRKGISASSIPPSSPRSPAQPVTIVQQVQSSPPNFRVPRAPTSRICVRTTLLRASPAPQAPTASGPACRLRPTVVTQDGSARLEHAMRPLLLRRRADNANRGLSVHWEALSPRTARRVFTAERLVCPM